MTILADSFYYQELRIDTINTRVFADLVAKEGDANGRGLLVTLTENGLMKDTTGIALNLKWEHTAVGNQGLDNFEIVDLTKGQYKITYPTEMLNRGKVNAFIQILDGGKNAGSRNIEITVDRGVGDDTAIASSDSFTALAQALIDVSNLESTYAPELLSVKRQLAQAEIEIDTKLSKTQIQQSVGFSDINKNLSLIDQTMLTQNLLEMIAGTAGVNVTPEKLSVLTDMVSNLAIIPEKTSFINKGVNLFNKNDPTVVSGSYLTNTGVTASNASYYITHKIYVSAGDTVTIPYAETAMGACYDKNGVFLSKIGTETGTLSPFTFTVPVNTYHIKLNGTVSNIANAMVVKGNSYPSTYVKFEPKLNNEFGFNDNQLARINEILSNFDISDDNLTNVVTIESPLNLIDESKKLYGYYLANGTLTADATFWTSDFIVANNGDVVRYSRDGNMGSGNTVKCYDANKNYLGQTALGDLDVLNIYRTVTIAVAGTKYIRISYSNGKLGAAMLTLNNDFPTVYEPYQIVKYLNDSYSLNNTQKTDILEVTQPNPLKGKIISLNGDSICYGAGFLGGYGKIIADKNGMVYENKGVAGATITAEKYYSDGTTPRHWISRTITTMRADADYIILEGGVNDANLSTPKGTVSVGYEVALDDTTFCGAFENMIKTAIDRFPGKKIGFILTHRMDTGFESFYPYIIQMLEKWGVSYCDLYKKCPPLNFIPYLKTNYTKDGDGWHLNETGYRAFYVDQIESWLKTL